MSTMLQSASGSFRIKNAREVVAVLTITRFSKPNFNRQTVPKRGQVDLFSLFNIRSGLVVRRPWYGLDHVPLDEGLAHKLRQPVIAVVTEDEIDAELNKAAFAQLVNNSQSNKSDRELVADIVETIPTFIKVPLEDDAFAMIKEKVPFTRLQTFLRRAASHIAKSNSGILNEVRIAHAPRFDNAGAAVKQLLDYDS